MPINDDQKKSFQTSPGRPPLNYHGNNKWHESNCSLCTVAGVLHYFHPGHGWTVNKVIEELKVSTKQREKMLGEWASSNKCKNYNGDADEDDNVLDQCRGLIGIISKKTKCRVSLHGSSLNRITLAGAKAWMNGMDAFTVFAVYYAYGPAGKRKAHWNFAHKQSGTLQFVDYQTDDGAKQSTVADRPVLGIEDAEEAPDDAQVIVAGFSPGGNGNSCTVL